MAGLFGWEKSEKLNLKKTNTVFSYLGYENAKHLDMGKWNVFVFPKKNTNKENWKIYNNGSICGIGTFGYKDKFYNDALPVIYNDLLAENIDRKEFWGQFIIVAYFNGTHTIIRDGAGISKLYRHSKLNIFSTSYAGIIDSLDTKFNFDPLAATELINTGVITGDYTILKEIRQVNSDDLFNFNIVYSKSKEFKPPTNRNEALNQQIDITSFFFNKIINEWETYSKEGIIDIGLTGGMDSRLLAIVALKQTKNVVFHTHWRKEQFNNSDFKYAHIFAKETGLEINSPQVKTSLEMSNDELERNFEKSYNFCDGIIRPGVYWDEEYSNGDYRTSLNSNPYLRLLGFGGEQYRNSERFSLNTRRSLSSWIKWEMIYQFAGRNFTDDKKAKLLENRIRENLIKTFNTNNLTLNLYTYKKYIQLVQSPSYRSIQSTIENKIGFCLSPFLDINLSTPSFLATPFLGKSLEFQLDMMKEMSHHLAAIPNGYGFNFTKGESDLIKLGSTIWEKIPPWLKYPLYAKYKKNYYSDYIEKLENKNGFIKDIMQAFDELNLPIILDKQKYVRSRSKLILNLGFFVLRNKNKIII